VSLGKYKLAAVVVSFVCLSTCLCYVFAQSRNEIHGRVCTLGSTQAANDDVPVPDIVVEALDHDNKLIETAVARTNSEGKFSIIVPETVRAYRLLVYDREANYFTYSPKADEPNDRHPADAGRILLYPRNKRLMAAEAIEQFETAEVIRSIDESVGEIAIKRLVSEYPESAHLRQVELLSQYLVLRDRFLADFFKQVRFTPPLRVAKTWHDYPSYRKLLIAADMAQSADKVHGADRLFGTMVYALAQRGDPVIGDPSLVAALDSAMLSSPVIQFGELLHPASPSKSLSIKQLGFAQALSKYTEAGALGTPQQVMVRYTGVNIHQAFDLLETSDSFADAVERALSKLPADKTESVLEAMVTDTARLYPPVRHETELAAFFPSNDGLIHGHDQEPGLGFQPPLAPGVGAPTYAVADSEVEAAFLEFRNKSYSTPAQLEFDEMRRNVVGFGGIIFGNDVSKGPAVKKIRSLTFQPASDYGAIRVTFDDGTEAIMPSVTLNEALSAHNLVFSDAETKAWTNGQGIPLVGLTYDCRPGYRRAPHAFDDETPEPGEITADRVRVVLNPALKDTTLGWSAIAADGRARFPVAMARAVKHEMKTGYSSEVQQELYNLIIHTFERVRFLGWKITDVPLKMSVLDSTIQFTRSDALDQFPFGLRRLAYLEMTPVDPEKSYPEFRGQFYQVSPILMKGLPEFRQINHYAGVLALVRLARIDGASFPTPSGFFQKVVTPEYAAFTVAGVFPDPHPICQKVGKSH
jgi:hypothetical protein